MSMELSGKVSIITGASSGIGEATAILFARKGAKVTLCGRDQERLEAALDQCILASGGHSDRFITVRGDLNNAKVREEIVAKTVEKFGQLDILVPNAGVMPPVSDLYTTTEESFDLTFNINCKSVFFLIQQAAPHLEKSKGNIVTVSSILSTMATTRMNTTYPMSKAAIDHMTRCLAMSLGPAGVRVNAVNPSFIPTNLFRSFPGNVEVLNKAFIESQKLMQPMGECGTAEDVAETICFLASDSAKFITGECLLVSGGRTLNGP